MADSRPTPSSGLAIRKIAAFQQFAAPLIVLSETAQQTALPLLESLVREGLDRGLGVVALCLESSLSNDIAQSPHAAIIDNRPSLEHFLAGHESPGRIDFDALEERTTAAIRQISDSRSSCLLLLWTSTSMTFLMLRSLRKLMTQTFGSDKTHRILTRYPRDTFAGHVENGREQRGSPILANSLANIADATIDVYPTDVLPSWCPGWFSDGKPEPFLALTHNDPHHCLLRLEQRRQSGKVGVEVATFEAVNGRPVFASVDVSGIVNPALPEPIAAPLPPKTQSTTSSSTAKGQQQQQQQQQTDPTANLSFNLSLTDKQREDKNSVVLPYTDAQMDEGSSGGEIHYQLDDEDDWDSDDPDDDLEI
ncbi:hypothetical protein FBU59_001699 [Linderina macrospora]|uniref:Uncharacterized protein n=1 Tax=Linderina macrospora TaxID=4868 RepID=A0ACC1JDH8_9FUNG|nr:hypothetical protein FBU59_001699 [Linderina macrospora]